MDMTQMSGARLTPAMQRMYTEALQKGYATGRTGTIVALMQRGLLREQNPYSGRNYLATDRDAVHAAALIETLERSWAGGQFPHWTEETFQWFIQRLRVEWSVNA